MVRKRSRPVVKAIRSSGFTIYDPLDRHPELFLDHQTLEDVLNAALVGLSLDYPLRTRSKVLKSHICEALGYPIPERFRKAQPRFPGQNFDTYVQKANNLQIWNEKVTASRRYVIVRVNSQHIVTRVRVVTGEVISRMDRTGTLTHKYQASSRKEVRASELVSPNDTPNVVAKLIATRSPTWRKFLPVRTVFRHLKRLLTTVIRDTGRDQERNRGGILHDAVCRQLGMPRWADDGQFPDVTEQLLEIKLQTARTIDLGLVCPDSEEQIADYPEFHHCDVRYAAFYGTIVATGVRLDNLILCTGRDFFSFFQQFGGKVRNAKLQIPLPSNFFD